MTLALSASPAVRTANRGRRIGRRALKKCVGTSAVALLAGSAAAEHLPRELQNAAKAYDAAQVTGDRAVLEQILATDYILINSRGQTETKSQLIADYTAPGFRLDPFTVEQPLTRIWPSGAVLGGIATLKGVSDGRPYEARLRFTDVWAKRRGRWQVIHTLVAPAVRPSV
jgi:ketosteroid isomerase-like protein